MLIGSTSTGQEIISIVQCLISDKSEYYNNRFTFFKSSSESVKPTPSCSSSSYSTVANRYKLAELILIQSHSQDIAEK